MRSRDAGLRMTSGFLGKGVTTVVRHPVGKHPPLNVTPFESPRLDVFGHPGLLYNYPPRIDPTIPYSILLETSQHMQGQLLFERAFQPSQDTQVHVSTTGVWPPLRKHPPLSLDPPSTEWKAIYQQRGLIVSMEKSELDLTIRQFSQVEAEIIYEQMLRDNLKAYISQLNCSITNIQEHLVSQRARRTQLQARIREIDSDYIFNSGVQKQTTLCLGILNS